MSGAWSVNSKLPKVNGIKGTKSFKRAKQNILLQICGAAEKHQTATKNGRSGIAIELNSFAENLHGSGIGSDFMYPIFSIGAEWN